MYSLNLYILCVDLPFLSIQKFDRRYLHYLLKIKETTAIQAISIHNIFFINKLMSNIRKSINNNSLHQEEKKWI
jgi:queuine tRNA-ribosyltransferase